MQNPNNTDSQKPNFDPIKRRNKIGCALVAIFSVLFIGSFFTIGIIASKRELKEIREKVGDSASEVIDNDSGVESPSETDAKKKTADSVNADNQKSSAGSTSQTGTTSTQNYTFLDFYIDIANTSIRGNEILTNRFNKSPVYIGGKETDDALDATYRACLTYFINDFNANSSFVKLENNAPVADIKIYFMTREELHNQYDTYLPFATTHPDGSGVIQSAEIIMPNNSGWPDDEKCWSLKHEIVHAVGFPGHSNKIDNSEMSFNPLYITYGGLSSSDQRAIRMLYSSGIPLLTNQGQVRSYFSARSY